MTRMAVVGASVRTGGGDGLVYLCGECWHGLKALGVELTAFNVKRGAQVCSTCREQKLTPNANT